MPEKSFKTVQGNVFMSDAHRIMAFPHEASVKKQAWRALTAPNTFVQQVCQKTGLPSFLAEVVATRVKTPNDADAFLKAQLKTHLPCFKQLPAIKKAAELITDAILSKQSIALWGDYDVDGATSTALWCRFLHSAGNVPRVYIPDRFKEGYGPNTQGIEQLKKEGIDLLITLDCGTTAFEPLEHAKKLGMCVVVVDHHDKAEALPAVDAIVNPKCKDPLEGDADLSILAAVGVSFFCLIALLNTLETKSFYTNKQRPDLRQLLDLVALGTVCDMVPLLGVNRLLVQKGLLVMAKRLNTGINALLEVNNHKGTLTATDLGFLLGPQLNAGGRLADTRLASLLLTTNDPLEATRLALQLKALNTERKTIQKKVETEGLVKADTQKEAPCILVHDTTWHEGVIGIAASRLKDATNKPAFVISFNEEGIGKGSARSIPGVHLGTLLHEACSKGLLLQGGGHAMAGGLTVENAKLAAFHSFCNAFIKAQNPPPPEKTFCGTLTLKSLTPAFWEALSQLGPFGAANPNPCFLFQDVRIDAIYPFGDGHLRLRLAQNNGGVADALLFSAHTTPFYPLVTQSNPKPFHCLATISKNSFTQKLQLFIEDIILQASDTKSVA
ncbi:MAG: single-stranded-DNA-specific exonuclease RecJ [Holosporaceae bacterium]